MFAAGVAVGDIGISAFYAHREVFRHKQVENTVDAVRRYAFSARCGYQFGYVIGGGRARESRQGFKYRRSRIGPFFTGLFQIGTRCISQRFTVMFVMIMFSHTGDLGILARKGKAEGLMRRPVI